MTPDDLQAYLILGELRYKAKDEKGATEAYAAYEVRRKALLDGLTLKKDGAYVAGPAERAKIATYLLPASDNGTALALLYALESDPEASVRDAIVELMGAQRLEGYKQGLEAYLAKAEAEESKKVAQWALGEIAREPMNVRPGAAPWAPESAGGAEKGGGKAPGEAAPKPVGE